MMFLFIIIAKKIIALIAVNLLLWVLVYLTTKRKRLNSLLLSVTAILLLLTLVELVYRYRSTKKTPVHTGTFYENVFKKDSLLGYTINKTGKLTAQESTYAGEVIFNTSYTIIPDSMKSLPVFNHRSGYAATGSKQEMVMLGCSFTFGEGLPDKATLAYMLGRQMNANTVNLGCNGYGINQVYALYNSKYGTASDTQRIFIYSLLYDHFLRANGVYSWSASGPFFKVEKDSLVFAGPVSANLALSNQHTGDYLSLFNTFHFLKDIGDNIAMKSRVKNLQPSSYEYCFLLLQKMAAAIRKSGGRFIILDWDKKNWGNTTAGYLPMEAIEKKLTMLSADGADVIRISSIIDLADQNNFIPQNGHPGAAANAGIARWLRAYLLRPGNRQKVPVK
jgi:hypothetical protein